jgi:hypothetical protein
MVELVALRQVVPRRSGAMDGSKRPLNAGFFCRSATKPTGNEGSMRT